MWTIIKFNNKQLSFLKKDLEKKLDPECKFYIPKLLLKKIKKKKIIKKEINLLGNYLFCFSKNFQDKKKLNLINYARGLKLVLSGFEQSQSEIHRLISLLEEEDKNCVTFERVLKFVPYMVGLGFLVIPLYFPMVIKYK